MLVRNRWNLRLYPPAEKVKLLEEIGKRYIETKKRPQIKKNPMPVWILKRMAIISMHLSCRTIR